MRLSHTACCAFSIPFTYRVNNFVCELKKFHIVAHLKEVHFRLQAAFRKRISSFSIV